MKKALIIANLAGFAGFLVRDMDTLQKMGYSVTFAANAGKMNWEATRRKLKEMNVSFVQIDFDSKNPFSRANAKALKQLKELLHDGQFDLIHCHTPIAGLLTRYAARKYRRKGTKVIYTTHGLSYTTWSGWKTKLIYKTIESLASRWCDAIITINEEDFVAIKKLHCKKTYKINGVGFDVARFRDVSFDRNAYRQEHGIGAEDIFVLAVGELSTRKNHQAVIEAIALLPNKEQYIFGICGGGIEGGVAEMLEKLANERDVRLKLFGFRNDIPLMMHASDIGVIPSLREGLGLSGVQSLAAGVPVVGTDVQGIRDYIIPRKTGYLTKPNDFQAIADGIRILSSFEKRNELHDGCIEIATLFDQGISQEQMASIYNELLNSKN